MTDQEMKIAIAESCGWTLAGGDCKYGGWIGPDKNSWSGEIPNYLNDLNAMHEAEMTLSYSSQSLTIITYLGELHNTIGGVPGSFSQYCATARQRAEAFLKTLGKWKI